MPEEKELEVIRRYIESLRELYDGVVKESYLRSKRETRVLFEILNSWIDAADLFKEYGLERIIHSISSVFFIYLWRLGNWIAYEILTGHYFEALRDVRFLFEGSILALYYGYLIDRKIYEKRGSFAALSLKF